MAAVSALPDLDLALCEDGGRLHVVQQGAIALLVMTLDLADHAEAGCQLREALGLGRLGKACIHVRPLVVLALCGRCEVLGRATDAGQLLLVVRRFEEQRRDLLVALLLCNGGKVGVLVAGLRFARKGGLQVLFSLRSGILRRFCHVDRLLC